MSVIDITEQLRVNSCRYAHESPDEAASRRIRIELAAADAIERLRSELEQAKACTERMWCRACGTVTRDQQCDCTRSGLDCQNLVNYADSLREDAREMSAELDQARGWQPRDTIPRDGSVILCYWGPAVPGGARAIDLACWVDGQWCDADDASAHFGEPDLWQPLSWPSPPSTDDQRAVAEMHATGRTKAGNDIGGI